MARILNRIRPIVLNAGLYLSAPFINVLASWWVIRNSSEAIWGEFVYPMLFAGLALHVLTWGHRDFLLRAFARHPDKMGIMWRQNLVSRGALLFIALPVVMLSGMSAGAISFLLLWIFAGFVRQSFETIIVYRKEFGFALLTEIAAALLLFFGLWWNQAELSGEIVLNWFALAWLLRAVLVLLKYGKEFLPGDYPRIQFRYFAVALPFFLLGFAGMLLSRIDMYCVALFVEDRAVLGRYQLLLSFLLYLQAVVAFVLLPYVKNLYRLPDRSFFKLARRMFLLGIAVVVPGVLAIYLLLTNAYQINFGMEYFALGAAFSLPVFYYSPIVYLLFKHSQQRKVLLANVGGILLNLGLNLLLIPRIGLPGALVATAGAQVCTLVLLVVYARRR